MFRRIFSAIIWLVPILVVATLASGFVAWGVVSRTETTLEEADATVDSLDEALRVTRGLLLDTSMAMGSLRQSMTQLEKTTDSGTQSIGDAAALTASLPTNLRNIRDGLDRTRGAADSVDSFTETLASTPLLGRGVDPTELGPAIAILSSDLDPLISDLDDASLSLDQLAFNVDLLSQDLPKIAEHLKTLQGDLADGADSMEALREGLTTALADPPDTVMVKLLIVLATLTAVGIELLLGAVLLELRSLKIVDRTEP